MTIIITAIITFIATAIWQKISESKSNSSLALILKGFMNELDNLSKIAGYKGIEEYWDKEKGEDYKRVAMLNYINALRSLE